VGAPVGAAVIKGIAVTPASPLPRFPRPQLSSIVRSMDQKPLG